MKKIITFGEIMLRLNPEGYLRLVQAEHLDASYAGGEANVAVSLVNYGNAAAFVTKVPSHAVGQCAVNALRRFGVDTSMILRGGPRLGIYFVEKGASQRGSNVIYDRAGSSIALSEKMDFDWNQIFAGADWFHFTGITPALGGELPAICLDAVCKAKSMGLTVSCDLNYRSKLWSREEAGHTLAKLMPYIDVCIGNEDDAKDVFGISAANTDTTAGKLDHSCYINVAQQIKERFDCQYVAITLRRSISANDNCWAGMLYDGEHAYFSPEYPIHIVDRVGGGDSFGGGLIHAMLKWPGEHQQIIDFAVAASCLKQTIEQDFNHMSESEVLSLVCGNTTGRVQR